MSENICRFGLSMEVYGCIYIYIYIYIYIHTHTHVYIALCRHWMLSRDLPRVIANRDGWRERAKGICDSM